MTFPVDVTSLPALTAILSILLSAKGLGRPLLESAYKVLTCLCTAGNFTGTFKLLPNDEKCWIDIHNGEFSRPELKQFLDRVGVGYQRLRD